VPLVSLINYPAIAGTSVPIAQASQSKIQVPAPRARWISRTQVTLVRLK